MNKYKARVKKVVSADILEVFINLGFNIYARLRVKLAGVVSPGRVKNTQESKQAALKAKEYITKRVVNQDVLLGLHDEISTHSRHLVTVYYDTNKCLNTELVKEGLVDEFIVSDAPGADSNADISTGNRIKGIDSITVVEGE